MMKITEFYDDVLKGDLTRIKNRSPKFPEFVLRSALQDGRKDVVDNLLSSGIEFDDKLIKQARGKSTDVPVSIWTTKYVMFFLTSIVLLGCCLW